MPFYWQVHAPTLDIEAAFIPVASVVCHSLRPQGKGLGLLIYLWKFLRGVGRNQIVSFRGEELWIVVGTESHRGNVTFL